VSRPDPARYIYGMSRFAIPVVGAAVLIAACGGAATPAKSASQPGTIAGTVQLSDAPNAGSDISDLGRANPQVRKGGPVPAIPPSPRDGGTVAAQPAGASLDRCQMGSGTGPSGKTGAPPGKHPPLPMCLPE
jgi:hypothetical protein